MPWLAFSFWIFLQFALALDLKIQVCKKNQKAAGANALRPRFKALYRNVFDRICSFQRLKQLLGFEPVRKGNRRLDAKSGFAGSWSCSACLPPQTVDEKESCTLYWCSGKGKSMWADKKLRVKIRLGMTQKVMWADTNFEIFPKCFRVRITGIFAFLPQTIRFSK